MARLTFQVLEGLEAGLVYRDLETPLTIGREEDNDIQLNDERISRFHVKVQENADRIILTDLDSTNGTRVNGHPVRMRVLQAGDLIMLGRCVLLVGGPEELGTVKERLADRMASSSETGEISTKPMDPSEYDVAFPKGPPRLPSELNAVQNAELGDLLEYIRTEILAALCLPTDEMQTDEGSYLRVHREAWRQLESIPGELARYLNELHSPR